MYFINFPSFGKFDRLSNVFLVAADIYLWYHQTYINTSYFIVMFVSLLHK